MKAKKETVTYHIFILLLIPLTHRYFQFICLTSCKDLHSRAMPDRVRHYYANVLIVLDVAMYGMSHFSLTSSRKHNIRC